MVSRNCQAVAALLISNTMDRLKSFSENLTVDKVKGELQPSSLKNRAKALNERYSSPSTQSTSYGRLVPPARPKPATLASDGGRSTSESGRMLPPRPAAPVRPSSGGQRERIVPEEEPPASAKGEERIDWPNLTHDDKLSLFAVLDQVGLSSCNMGEKWLTWTTFTSFPLPT